MSQIKYTSLLFIIILLIVFVSFFYFGIVHKNPTSVDNNMTIVKSIMTGKFIYFNSGGAYDYYPGSSHAIIALSLLLGTPVNLVGLLAWVCLFFACKKLGSVFGLNMYMALVFAGSFCTTISVIRTIADQSIDKWLCVWFVLIIILLEKKLHTWKSILLLGLSLGMLIGSKYTGPLFFLALLPIYGRTFIQILSPFRFLILSVMISIFGLFWYIRNYFLKGSPYYPGDMHLPFFKGEGGVGMSVQDWAVWKIPFVYPDAIVPMINAFISEYMIWSLTGIVILGFVIYSYRNKKIIDRGLKRVILLTLTTGLISLLFPITPLEWTENFHIISNMRYIYIFVLMSILAVFLIVHKYKKNSILATIALINCLPLFSFLYYQPKIFIPITFFVLLLYFKPIYLLKKYINFN